MQTVISLFLTAFTISNFVTEISLFTSKENTHILTIIIRWWLQNSISETKSSGIEIIFMIIMVYYCTWFTAARNTSSVYADITARMSSFLSATDTPTYNVSKFLSPILSRLTVNEFAVHDSFHLQRFVNFDVNFYHDKLRLKSLFINIPFNETIENCMNNFFYNNDTVHNLIKDDLKELLKFASYEPLLYLITNIII